LDEQRAEEAAHAHAHAIVEGDYGAMVRTMTPDGLAKAMQLGNTTWTDLSYEVGGRERDGDDFVFSITYHTDIGPLTLRERFRLVGDEWKVVDVEKAE
jgi:hypothetical protein